MPLILGQLPTESFMSASKITLPPPLCSSGRVAFDRKCQIASVMKSVGAYAETSKLLHQSDGHLLRTAYIRLSTWFQTSSAISVIPMSAKPEARALGSRKGADGTT